MHGSAQLRVSSHCSVMAQLVTQRTTQCTAHDTTLYRAHCSEHIILLSTPACRVVCCARLAPWLAWPVLASPQRREATMVLAIVCGVSGHVPRSSSLIVSPERFARVSPRFRALCFPCVLGVLLGRSPTPCTVWALLAGLCDRPGSEARPLPGAGAWRS